MCSDNIILLRLLKHFKYSQLLMSLENYKVGAYLVADLDGTANDC